MHNPKKVTIKQATTEVQKLATAIKKKQAAITPMLQDITPLWRAFYILGMLPGSKRCKQQTAYFQDEFLYLLTKSIPGTHQEYLVYLDQLELVYPSYFSYFLMLHNYLPQKDDFITDRLISNISANLIYSEALEDHRAFGELLSWLCMASLLEGCAYDFKTQITFECISDFFSYCAVFLTCRICKKLGFFHQYQCQEETLVTMLERTLKDDSFKNAILILLRSLEQVDPAEDTAYKVRLESIQSILCYFQKPENAHHIAPENMQMIFEEMGLRQELTVHLIILYNTLQLSHLKAQKDIEDLSDVLQSKDKKLVAYRNKNAQLADKVKHYKKKLDHAYNGPEKIVYQADPQVQQELIQLKNSNAKLKSRVCSLEAKLMEKSSERHNLEQPIQPMPIEQQQVLVVALEDIIKKLSTFKIIVVGGPPYYAQKLTSVLPSAKVFDKTCQLKAIKIGKADVVVIFAKIISHAKRIQAETQASKVGAKVFYIDVTNQELFCRELYRLMGEESE